MLKGKDLLLRYPLWNSYSKGRKGNKILWSPYAKANIILESDKYIMTAPSKEQPFFEDLTDPTSEFPYRELGYCIWRKIKNHDLSKEGVVIIADFFINIDEAKLCFEGIKNDKSIDTSLSWYNFLELK